MLIDDVIADRRMREELGASCINSMASSMIIRAQNVADYLYVGTSTEEWGMEDFPNCAPVSPNLWVEWDQPRTSRSGGKLIDMTKSPGWCPATCGVFMVAYSRDQAGPAPESSWTDDIRWSVESRVFYGIAGKVHHIGSLIFMVHKSGALRPVEGTHGLGYKIGRDMQGGDNLATAHDMKIRMFVPWLALSFMHCKNVKVDKGPSHSKALQKSRARKGRAPLMRWHTIEIGRVKKIIADSNGGSNSLSPKALHICRGHFKDFSEHGLFGKLHGTYWWPMHKRGDESLGVVMKDYTPVAEELKEQGAESRKHLALPIPNVG